MSCKAREELDGRKWKGRAFQAAVAVAGSRKEAVEGQGWRSPGLGKRPGVEGTGPLDALHRTVTETVITELALTQLQALFTTLVIVVSFSEVGSNLRNKETIDIIIIIKKG